MHLPPPFWTELSAAFGNRSRRNEPLARHTTSRLGGPADVWLPVNSTTELVDVVLLARRHQVPIFILGSGANLLITDAGIRGLVIENRAGQMDFPEEKASPGQPVTVTAASGAVLPSLARRCAQRGLSGLEWAVGVPGTLGGAVVNNAGAYGSDMAAGLRRAELLTPSGQREWQPVEWFDYAYRTSRLKRGMRSQWVVLQAELQLVATPVAEVTARMSAFNERRKSSQPPGATMGSMFKNPPGDYAGRLLEAAGLKGYQVGRAQISPVHANFFQNLGAATATDMLKLIEAARNAVNKKFNVELELEIEVVGEIFP